MRYAQPAEVRRAVAPLQLHALFGVVLNIGKLSVGAAEYYLGEVASAAEDYYTGHGEAQGRWVGSIAAELGLHGTVDADHFRLVLAGRHPFSKEHLVSAQGSAARARGRQGAPSVDRGRLPEAVDSLRAAAHLGVSGQYVRRLLAEGQKYSERLAKAEPGEEVVRSGCERRRGRDRRP